MNRRPARRPPRTTIHIVDAGSGVPVLMLHGIGGSADSFAEQINAFASTHRVLAWDAPGYARSTANIGDLAEVIHRPQGCVDNFCKITAKYAEVAADVLRERDAAPAHVVGASWGSVIATRLALDHPELVRSLVLAGPSRGSGRSPDKAAVMRERVADLERLGPDAFARERAPHLLPRDAPKDLVDRVANAMARSIRLPGYADAAESMATTDHGDEIDKIIAPTLVIVGEHDVVTGVPEAEAMAAAILGARLVVLPGAGHACNQERPDAFNRLLAEWL